MPVENRRRKRKSLCSSIITSITVVPVPSCASTRLSAPPPLQTCRAESNPCPVHKMTSPLLCPVTPQLLFRRSMSPMLHRPRRQPLTPSSNQTAPPAPHLFSTPPSIKAVPSSSHCRGEPFHRRPSSSRRAGRIFHCHCRRLNRYAQP
ncbi:hypothetical protein M0R45_007536 [Rubus argutus]|uniref:Uncharacterized protein n=1 Tax=Rubus argutus TaxID=59490 RepID=A0AAW1XYN4_RUBAR